MAKLERKVTSDIFICTNHSWTMSRFRSRAGNQLVDIHWFATLLLGFEHLDCCLEVVVCLFEEALCLRCAGSSDGDELYVILRESVDSVMRDGRFPCWFKVRHCW